MDPTQHLHRSLTNWLCESLVARYVEVDVAVNDKALARFSELDTKMRRHRPLDALKQFLQALKLCADRSRPQCTLAQEPPLCVVPQLCIVRNCA